MTSKEFIKKFNWIFILTVIIFYVISFYAVGFYLDSAQYIHKYDFENPVKAVFTDIQESLSPSRHGRYQLIYEYMAPDGTFYAGPSRIDYPKSEAESFIGKEVDIYIDGKGDSTIHNYSKDNRNLYLIFGIVFLLLGTATIIIAVILHKRNSHSP